MNYGWALDFDCDKNLEEIMPFLNEHSQWKWIERDNDNLGFYTSSIGGFGFIVKIYYFYGDAPNHPEYTLEVKIMDENHLEESQIDLEVRKLLDQLEARNIRPGETYS